MPYFIVQWVAWVVPLSPLCPQIDGIQSCLALSFHSRLAFGPGFAADPDPAQNPGQLVEIEPDAVFVARINDDPAPSSEIATVHHLAANGATSIHRPALLGCICRYLGASRGTDVKILDRQVRRRLADELFQDTGIDPHSRATVALLNRDVADPPAAKPRHLSADGANQVGLLAGERFRHQGQPAMVAELGPIADPREATGADRVEVLLVQGEIGAAMRAGRAPMLPRRTARRAANDRGVVALRTANCNDRPAMAAEPASDRPSAGVELAAALRTGD